MKAHEGDRMQVLCGEGAILPAHPAFTLRVGGISVLLTQWGLLPMLSQGAVQP